VKAVFLVAASVGLCISSGGKDRIWVRVNWKGKRGSEIDGENMRN